MNLSKTQRRMLALLDRLGELSGRDLAKAYDAAHAFYLFGRWRWEISYGAIYVNARELEELGLVVSREVLDVDRRRLCIAITPAGRAEVHR